MENRLEQLSKEIKEAQDRFNKEVKDSIQQELKRLFDTYKELNELSWKGYTPSFNDGDPCVFRLSGIEINGESEDDYLEEHSTLVEPSEELSDAVGELQKFMYSNKDYVEKIYGNDTEVSITRNEDGSLNVQVDSYYND